MNVSSKKGLLLTGCLGMAMSGAALASAEYVPGELLVKLKKG